MRIDPFWVQLTSKNHFDSIYTPSMDRLFGFISTSAHTGAQEIVCGQPNSNRIQPEKTTHMQIDDNSTLMTEEESFPPGSIWKILRDDQRVVSIRSNEEYFVGKEKFYEHLDFDRTLDGVDEFHTYTGHVPLRNQPTDAQRHFLSWAMQQREYRLPDDIKNRRISKDWLHPFASATTRQLPTQIVYGGGSGDKCGTGKSYELLELVACNTPTFDGALGEQLLSDVLNNATLVVAPASVIDLTWRKEIKQHAHANQFDVLFYVGSNRRRQLDTLFHHYKQTLTEDEDIDTVHTDYLDVFDAATTTKRTTASTDVQTRKQTAKQVSSARIEAMKRRWPRSIRSSAEELLSRHAENTMNGQTSPDTGKCSSTIFSHVSNANVKQTNPFSTEYSRFNSTNARKRLYSSQLSNSLHREDKKPTRIKLLNAAEFDELETKRICREQNRHIKITNITDVRNDNKKSIDKGEEHKNMRRFTGHRPLIVFTSYETLTVEMKELTSRTDSAKKEEGNEKQSLFDIVKVWWRIWLDESHTIRNTKTGAYHAV